MLPLGVFLANARRRVHALLPEGSQLGTQPGEVVDNLLVGTTVPLVELLAIEEHVVQLLLGLDDHVVQDLPGFLHRSLAERLCGRRLAVRARLRGQAHQGGHVLGQLAVELVNGLLEVNLTVCGLHDVADLRPLAPALEHLANHGGDRGPGPRLAGASPGSDIVSGCVVVPDGNPNGLACPGGAQSGVTRTRGSLQAYQKGSNDPRELHLH
mmetsp:Transcript_1340/g.4554  ORF Transcript_1340/g.4554 Transcript_1340/m.4554 type:complete len:211 (-) Transcript_1340:71-703(-)